MRTTTKLGWVVKTLVPQRDKPDDLSGPIPWLRIEDFDGKFVSSSKSGQGVTRSQVTSMPLKVFPARTVVTSCSCTMGATAIARNPLVTNQTFIGLVPDESRLLADFLYYYLQAMQPELQRQASGAIQQYLSQDEFRALRIDLLPLHDQRRIVGYLDDQVARMDEALRLRRAQIDALGRRAAVAADVALAQRGWKQPSSLEAEAVRSVPDGWRVARLSQVLRQLTNGFVGPTRDILTDQGIRYIQGMHIKGGAIDFDRRHFFVSEAWHAARPRIHLREGDVLIVQTGDIGRVAVVPPGFGEASCHALQIARVHEHVLSGEYLGAFLGSSFGYHSLLSRATGALHPHLEGGIRSIPLIVPPHDVQRAVVNEVSATRKTAQDAQLLMHEQISLLEKRKRSLISAAVTGDFDVTTAGGRGI